MRCWLSSCLLPGHVDPVTACDAGGAAVGAARIEARTVIWAAGVAASAAARWLGAERDRVGRALVGAALSLPGHPEIMVVGDTAHVAQADGRPCPGIAPAAKQMGRYAAARVAGAVRGRPAPAPFRSRHDGILATIGRQAAVVEMGRLRLTGRPAWLLWGAAHVWFLIGFRNRLAVTLDWLWSYVTFQKGARLIVGGE